MAAAGTVALPLASKLGFESLALSRLQIEGMFFDIANNTLALHLAFKTAQRALDRFTITQFNTCHIFS